jgi:rubrerythrin
MSNKDYSNKDALKIALNIEKDGYDFYEAAAVKAKDEKVKKIFLMLANEEKRHLVWIRKIQDGLVNPMDYFISDEALVEDYLRRIIETRVFETTDDVSKVMEDVKTDKDAIRLAMQFEKDSMDFFVKMSELTKNPDGQAAFKKLAGSEEHHLMELKRLQDNIANLENATK